MTDKEKNKDETTEPELREEETKDEENGKVPEENASEDEDGKKAIGDPVKELQAQLEATEQEKQEYEDRWKRAYAEFENYKKRSARETETFRKFANESLIKALLPVVDNLERAIESSGNGTDAQGESGIVEGVDMTLKEILKILDKFHVKAVSSLGQSFDPAIHEAMMQEESDEHPENTVTKELQKGYILHDRLLRPAMVVVSKAKTTNSQQ